MANIDVCKRRGGSYCVLRTIALACLVCVSLTVGAGRDPAFGQIEGNSWTPIGPAPIDGFFAGGVTGRASAIATNPHNTNEVWVGSAAGGLFRSYDRGVTFDNARTNKMPALAIGAIALADCPDAPDSTCRTIYVGTGENAIRRDTYYGRGLLIGTPDEFGTLGWRIIRGDPAASIDFELASINDIVIDPRTSGAATHIYMTVSSGVTVSASEATKTINRPASAYGIFKSEDQGQTWRRLTVPGTEGSVPTDLEMIPPPPGSNPAEVPLTLYAGFMGRGIFKSTTGGASWVNLPVDATAGVTTDFVEIAIAPSDPNRMYATFGMCVSQIAFCPAPSIKLVRSINGGDSWEEKPINIESHSRYTHGLAIKPNDPDFVLIGGVDLWVSPNWAAEITRSDAVNISLTPVTSGGRPTVHSDHREILFHPRDPNLVFATGDGGFAVSTNAGQNWVPRNDNLPITGFHSLGVGSVDIEGRRRPILIGGSQDNGVSIFGGSRRWIHAGTWGQDAGFSFVDKLFSTAPDSRIIYAGGNYGTPRMSVNGGDTWTNLSNGLSGTNRIFYAPFLQDEDAPHDLYLGGERLYRKQRGADGTWTAVSPEGLNEGQTSPEIWTTDRTGANTITAIALASGSTRTYIGFYGGQLYSSDDPCPEPERRCWTRLTHDGFPEDVPVTWIEAAADGAVYVTFSGVSDRPKVWKLTEASGWQPIVNGLPQGVPANVIAAETGDPLRLWLGMDGVPNPEPDVGGSIYKSVDGGMNWEPFSRGLPNVPVFQIKIDEEWGRVFAATHGRSAFVLGQPFLSNYEGWVHGGIWDIPLYGHNFPAEEMCRVRILRSDGTACAEGTHDALGGRIQTDADRKLISRRDPAGGPTRWGDLLVVWGCLNGDCVYDGDRPGASPTPIERCNENIETNPLSSVEVTCGTVTATSTVLGCPTLSNPPSTFVDVELADAFNTRASAPSAAVMGAMQSTPPGSGPQNFEFSALLQSSNHARSLCSVSVAASSDENSSTVLRRLRDAIDGSSTCAGAGVRADLAQPEPSEQAGEEDIFSGPPRLHIRGRTIEGGQLMTALNIEPGNHTGGCFGVGSLGVPLLGQLNITRLSIRTDADGADGGELTITEGSLQGACGITIETTNGQSAAEIARAIRDAFQAPGVPGPHPGCPSSRNPRDVSLDGESVIMVMASSARFCTTDTGVGFAFRSEEVLNVHPIAEAGEDQSLPTEGRSGTDVKLDGTGSRDPDSTPGTNDDISSYQWFDLSNSNRLLGTGATLTARFEPGTHLVRLIVTDSQGHLDSDEVVISIGLDEFLGIPNWIWHILCAVLLLLLLLLLIVIATRRKRENRTTA